MTSVARQSGDNAPARCCRVLIGVPPDGLGEQLALMRAWLDHHCGRFGWTAAPAGTAGIVNDALAFYVPDRRVACAFIKRFSCGYRAPPQPGL